MVSQVNNCFFRLLDLSPLVFVPDLEKYSNRKQKTTRISELVETVDKTMCMFDMHFSNSKTNLLIIKIISMLRTAFFTCLLLGKVILYVQVREIKSLDVIYTMKKHWIWLQLTNGFCFHLLIFWTLVKFIFFKKILETTFLTKCHIYIIFCWTVSLSQDFIAFILSNGNNVSLVW